MNRPGVDPAGPGGREIITQASIESMLADQELHRRAGLYAALGDPKCCGWRWLSRWLPATALPTSAGRFRVGCLPSNLMAHRGEESSWTPAT